MICMPNRRLIVIILMLLPLVMTWGRPRFSSRNRRSSGSELELAVGGGWSYLNYRPLGDNIPNTGSYALKFHVGYAYFFTKNIGLSLGADIQRYGTTLSLSPDWTWQNVVDTDSEPYEHWLKLDNWNERHQTINLEIPLAVVFSFPIEKWRLRTEIGVKYAFPLAAGSRASGTITHLGYYDPWHLTLMDLLPYGFYTTSDFSPKSTLKFQGALSAFLKVGVSIPLTRQLDLSCKLYCDYGITNILPENYYANEPVGFRNDREGMHEAHYFMNDYTNLLNTDQIGNKGSTLAVGVEIGISYFISGKRSSSCNCIRNYNHFRRRRR